MNIFDIPQEDCPRDANYFFNVLVINIAVRRSLQKDKEDLVEDIWDIQYITAPRPYVIHFYAEDDEYFDEDENYIIELYGHSAVEISPSLGICFYSMMDDEEEEDWPEEEDGSIEEIEDPEDWWRLD